MDAVEAQRFRTDASTEDLFLGGALKIRQPRDGYRAGTDAVLLAASVGSETAGLVLDAGAGVGVVGLCVAWRCSKARVVLIERERRLAELACRNVESNGLEARVGVVETDVVQPGKALEAAGIESETFLTVLANPPYHDENCGTVAGSPLKAASHQMPGEALESWARFMCRMAAPDGRAVIIHKAEALPRILEVYEGRFGNIRILPIHARAGQPAIRVIVDGIKGSRAPLSIRPGFVLHGADGKFAPEVDAIFRAGAPLAALSGG